MDDFKLNMSALIALSNEVNEQVCRPMAEAVAARARAAAPVETGAYRDSIHVVSDPRTGRGDWAHTYVVADDRKAWVVESRTGILARALGAAR